LAILRLAKKKALGGPHIHEVYIDECQDNQIVDLALILKVFDRADSIFLAGDIAQCIARGSSFRFQGTRRYFLAVIIISIFFIFLKKKKLFDNFI
jgi:hypothetical protein